MAAPRACLLSVPVPRPRRGASTRVRQGRLELVLEAVRGGFQLVVHDGHRGQRHFLGLPEDGELELRARAPRFPVLVALSDPVTLAPGGRLRGYVLVPLRRQLLRRGPGGDGECLLELLPAELGTEWDEAHGYRHRTTSPFLPHARALRDDPRALVPLVLRHRGPQPLEPGELPVTLADDELFECRGRVVGAPRRLQFLPSGQVAEEVRSRRRAAQGAGT